MTTQTKYNQGYNYKNKPKFAIKDVADVKLYCMNCDELILEQYNIKIGIFNLVIPDNCPKCGQKLKQDVTF